MTLISPENRHEFDDLEVDQLRKRVENSTYDPEKLRQARAYLREKDPAWRSVQIAEAASTRANIALFIAGISALAAAATFLAPYIASMNRPQLSAQGQQIYDQCLVSQNGNTVACDAYIRVLQRLQQERKQPIKGD